MNSLDGTIDFQYRFRRLDAGREEVSFNVTLNAATLELIRAPGASAPEWTRLDIEQCPCCPLDSGEHGYCPAALALTELIERFAALLSYTGVELTVITAERTVIVKTSMQRAVSSLMGLYMATSGCPALAFLKPMARFHLPVSTRQETVYRSVSAYLLGQYLRRKRGLSPDTDLQELRKKYEELHIVNKHMAARLRRASQGDANLNALIVLDLFAQELPYSIAENVAGLEGLFSDYLPDAGTASSRSEPEAAE